MAWAPRGGEIAVVRHSDELARSELVLENPARRAHERLLFSGPGRFGDPQWSPDGHWLLLPWPIADQWLFLRTAPGREKLLAFANIAAQFAPDVDKPPFPSAVGWCCRAPRAEP